MHPPSDTLIRSQNTWDATDTELYAMDPIQENARIRPAALTLSPGERRKRQPMRRA